MAEQPPDPHRPVFVRPGQQPPAAPPPVPADVYGQPPAPQYGQQPPQGGYALTPQEAPPPHAVAAAYQQAADGQVPSAAPPEPSRGGGIGFPPEDPVRPWPWWVSILGLVTAVIAVIGAGIVLGVVVAATHGGKADALNDYDYLLGLVQDVLWIGVAIAVPLMVARWIRPEHLGLRPRPRGWSLLKLVLVMVGFYIVAAIYTTAAGLDEHSNQLLQDTGFGGSLGKDIAYAILYPVAAPVAEELLFRGVLFKGLRDGFRGAMGRGPAVGLAALISGSIFGAAHLGGGQDDFIPVLIALGVLLALAYEWSGTLYVPIAIHALNNAIATGSSSTPTHDWIYGLIAAGPVLAVLLAMALARLVRRLPGEPKPVYPYVPPGPGGYGGPPQGPSLWQDPVHPQGPYPPQQQYPQYPQGQYPPPPGPDGR